MKLNMSKKLGYKDNSYKILPCRIIWKIENENRI